MKKTIAILLIFIAFSYSCKKENSAGSPTVQIIVPTGTPTYSVFDTVIVKANVSDVNGLQSVSVYIVNNQNEPVLSTAVIPITGKQMAFTCSYILNNIHLTTGQYSIVVKAVNSANATFAYKQININAAPTVRMGIYAVTRNSGGVHVLKIDSLFNIAAIYTQGGDYSSSDISSYYQQLYVSAADSGNANGIDLPAGSPQWGVNGIISPVPYFTNVYSNGNTVYISEYKGFIYYYNSAGVLNAVYNVTTGNYPIKTTIWGNYLFAEEKNIGSTVRNLVLYNAATTIGFEQNPLQGPVTAMYGMDNNDLFVFGNKDTGGAYLQLFSISGNVFYSPITLPNARLLSVAQINTQTYLLGFSNGTIYLYTYNPNSIVPFINGITASHLQYDYSNNEVIVASSKYVYEYNYTSMVLLHTANAQDSVLNVHVLYNK